MREQFLAKNPNPSPENPVWRYGSAIEGAFKVVLGGCIVEATIGLHRGYIHETTVSLRNRIPVQKSQQSQSIDKQEYNDDLDDLPRMLGFPYGTTKVFHFPDMLLICEMPDKKPTAEKPIVERPIASYGFALEGKAVICSDKSLSSKQNQAVIKYFLNKYRTQATGFSTESQLPNNNICLLKNKKFLEAFLFSLGLSPQKACFEYGKSSEGNSVWSFLDPEIGRQVTLQLADNNKINLRTLKPEKNETNSTYDLDELHQNKHSDYALARFWWAVTHNLSQVYPASIMDILIKNGLRPKTVPPSVKVAIAPQLEAIETQPVQVVPQPKAIEKQPVQGVGIVRTLWQRFLNGVPSIGKIFQGQRPVRDELSI